MAVSLKNAAELQKMYRAGQLLARVLDAVEAAVKPGVSTGQLDAMAQEMIEAAGARGAFKGYHGFPAVLCTSVNEAVVHGIPSMDQVLQQGDVVSVDCGVILEGFFADSARTIPVGEVDPEVKRLLEVTSTALEKAIAQCKPGGRLGNVGAAIGKVVGRSGFSLTEGYCGHGIGRQLHEDPAVPNEGRAGRGRRLQPGLVLAIEPMVNMGTGASKTLSDGWTVVTRDGRYAAHFEHTVAITPKGPWVLTQTAQTLTSGGPV